MIDASVKASCKTTHILIIHSMSIEVLIFLKCDTVAFSIIQNCISLCFEFLLITRSTLEIGMCVMWLAVRCDLTRGRNESINLNTFGFFN